MPPLPDRLLASVAVALLLTVFFGLIHAGVLSWGALQTVLISATLFVVVPRLLMRGASRFSQWSHERTWRAREGQHHEFAGTPMDLREDAQHLWVEAAGLKRALDTAEPTDVFAARVASGRWRREGPKWWLRADAVVEHLGQGASRDDVRRQRVRRWLDARLSETAVRQRSRTPSP